MADTMGASSAPVGQMQISYMEMVQRKRLYSGLTLLIFSIFMVAGFNTAASRNGGWFWDGIGNFFDYPSEVVSEAWQNADRMPGYMVEHFSALI